MTSVTSITVKRLPVQNVGLLPTLATSNMVEDKYSQRKSAGISFTQRPILRFFAPQGATRCTDGGEIWHRCNDKGVGPPKLKFLLRFDQNVEYKRPAGAYPLRNFHKICRVCTSFQGALGVKIWLDLLKGLWSYGGFKLRGSGFPQIFSAP